MEPSPAIPKLLLALIAPKVPGVLQAPTLALLALLVRKEPTALLPLLVSPRLPLAPPALRARGALLEAATALLALLARRVWLVLLALTSLLAPIASKDFGVLLVTLIALPVLLAMKALTVPSCAIPLPLLALLAMRVTTLLQVTSIALPAQLVTLALMVLLLVLVLPWLLPALFVPRVPLAQLLVASTALVAQGVLRVLVVLPMVIEPLKL